MNIVHTVLLALTAVFASVSILTAAPVCVGFATLSLASGFSFVYLVGQENRK